MKNKLIIIFSTIIVVALALFIVIVRVNMNNKKANIVLKTNAGIPYKWECDIEDENVVEFSDIYSKDRSGKKNITGGPIDVYYVLKGKREGTTQIVCKHKSITNEEDAGTRKFNIKVDSKLKVEIDEK